VRLAMLRGVVQTGDPTNQGDGGESIYGAEFKDEIHQVAALHHDARRKRMRTDLHQLAWRAGSLGACLCLHVRMGKRERGGSDIRPRMATLDCAETALPTSWPYCHGLYGSGWSLATLSPRQLCVCVCARARACVRACVRVRARVCVCVCVRARACVCMRAHVCKYAGMQACMYVSMRARMYVWCAAKHQRVAVLPHARRVHVAR
jgi:hypothetical protein